MHDLHTVATKRLIGQSNKDGWSHRVTYIFLRHEGVVEGQALHAVVQCVHAGHALPLLSHMLAVPDQRRLVPLQLPTGHSILLQPPHLLNGNLHAAIQPLHDLSQVVLLHKRR